MACRHDLLRAFGGLSLLLHFNIGTQDVVTDIPYSEHSGDFVGQIRKIRQITKP